MVKRSARVCVLLLVLALPVFGGVVRPGGANCTNVDCLTCFDASCPDINSVAPGKGEPKRTSPDFGDSAEAGAMLFALALLIIFRLRS